MRQYKDKTRDTRNITRRDVMITNETIGLYETISIDVKLTR